MHNIVTSDPSMKSLDTTILAVVDSMIQSPKRATSATELSKSAQSNTWSGQCFAFRRRLLPIPMCGLKDEWGISRKVERPALQQVSHAVHA